MISCQKCRAIACRAIAIRAVHPHSIDWQKGKILDNFLTFLTTFHQNLWNVQNLQEYEKCKIIENYVSFIDSINYLSLSIVEKQTINFKLFLPDIKIEDIIYLNEDISFVYK